MMRRHFWHYVRYNPPALFRYWVAHMRKPSNNFWLMMSWNDPILLMRWNTPNFLG